MELKAAKVTTTISNLKTKEIYKTEEEWKAKGIQEKDVFPNSCLPGFLILSYFHLARRNRNQISMKEDGHKESQKNTKN